MTYKLNEHQKNELVLLFDIESDTEKAIDLFLNIEYQMEECFLPNDGSRKVIALEKAKLLNDISSSSKKLRILLERLDETLRSNIDSKLGRELGKPYLHGSFKVGGEPAVCTDSISSLKAMCVVEEESAFLSGYLATNYGKGYMEKVIGALAISWPHYHQIPKLSTDSAFVQYLAIVLEENSYEKLYKQIKRSKWYADQQKISQFPL